jgi:hypothetical protein
MDAYGLVVESGIHTVLKQQRRKDCGFESHRDYFGENMPERIDTVDICVEHSTYQSNKLRKRLLKEQVF